MIKNNEKIIVISGMAHSGTTILAYILQQHPEIYCFTNGDQACILENDLLLNKQNETIEFVINSHFPKRILLKRPWTECKVLDWFSQELPNARFIYCYKAFEDITKSWCKPTSWISEELRSASEEKQKNCVYSDMGWEVLPESIYLVLKEVSEYGLPIFITESGLADS